MSRRFIVHCVNPLTGLVTKEIVTGDNPPANCGPGNAYNVIPNLTKEITQLFPGGIVSGSGDQDILNKDLTDPSNMITADALRAADDTSINIKSGPPSIGQILMATGSTAATWQANSATGIATTGAPVITSGAAPPSAGQVLTAIDAVTANWGSSSSVGKTVIVAKSSGDATTIAGGITSANALTPSSSNPVTVLVYPGIYSEVNPLVIPAFVSVVGIGGSEVTTITPTTTTTNVVTITPFGLIDRMGVRGATGAGGIGIKAATAGVALIRSCIVDSCETGIVSSGAGVILVAQSTAVRNLPSFAATTGFLAEAGSTMQLVSSTAAGSPGVNLITNGIRVIGSGSIFHSFSTSTLYCTNGVVCDDGAVTSIKSHRIDQCTNGLRIGSVGSNSEIILSSCLVDNSTTFDVIIESATGRFEFIGCKFDAEKLSIAAGSIFFGTHLNTVAGSLGTILIGDISIGNQFNTSRTGFGGGLASTNGMVVLSDTDIDDTNGGFVDNTTAAKSFSGSTFSVFQGTTAGNTLYVGGDAKFFGIETNTTIGLVIGAGALIYEYWNGSAWAAVNVMAAQKDLNHLQYADNIFQRVQTETLRFDSVISPLWATKLINGSTKYWFRIRISTGITTGPTFEQVKLILDSVLIESDGSLEYFGASRPRQALVFQRNLLNDIVGAAPANETIEVTAGIRIAAADNQFNNGATDSRGGIILLPAGICTSCPVTITMGWAVIGTNTGDVEWELEYAPVKIGDVLQNTITGTFLSNIVTVGAASDDVLQQTTFSIPINTLVNDEYLAIRIFREGGAGNVDDTLAADVYLVDIAATGNFWK